MTAVFAPGCRERVYTNPMPPQSPPSAEPTATAEPTGTAEPTATPTASASAPAADLASLPDPPAGWRLERNPDGSCTAIPAPMECPPTATCNPAPPFRVKCVADAPQPAPKK
jgi:hypothetical protein